VEGKKSPHNASSCREETFVCQIPSRWRPFSPMSVSLATKRI
jgi:hypothetical protein